LQYNTRFIESPFAPVTRGKLQLRFGKLFFIAYFVKYSYAFANQIFG
jgi:hypothetical protein